MAERDRPASLRERLRACRARLTGDVGWSLAANVTLTVANAATGILTARLLGPEGRGHLAVIVLWPSVLCVLSMVGFPHAFAYFAGRNTDRVGGVLKLALCCAVVQGTAAILAALVLFPLILRNQGASVIRLALLLCLMAPVDIAWEYMHSMLRGWGRLRAWNLLRVGATAVYLLGIALLALAGCSSVSHNIAVLALCRASAAGGALAVLWRSVDRSQPVARDLLRPVSGYGARNFMAGLSLLANTRLDQMLMTLFLLPQQIGYYVAAVSLSGILGTLGQAFASVALPRVTKSAGAHAAVPIIRRALLATLLLALPAGALMFSCAPWLLRTFYGAFFVAATPAARVLLIASVALGLNQVLSEALRGLNRPQGPAMAEMTGLIISFAGLWLLLPKLGITGAALASLGSYFVVSSVLLTCLWRTLRDERRAVGVSPIRTLDLPIVNGFAWERDLLERDLRGVKPEVEGTATREAAVENRSLV